jgi:hypothetical protein
MRTIEGRLFLPTQYSADAWFDAAGIVIGFTDECPNYSIDEWLNEKAHVQEWTHEYLHFIQFIAFPFLCDWSYRWRDLCLELINRSNLFNSKGSFFSFSEIDIKPFLPATQELVNYLILPHGELHISVRDLYEAHATFVEAIILEDVSDADSYNEYLESKKMQACYCAAYNAMRLICGDERAYRLFNAVIIVAFLQSDPVLAFESIITQISISSNADCDSFQYKAALSWTDKIGDILSMVSESNDDELSYWYRYTDDFFNYLIEIKPITFVKNPKKLNMPGTCEFTSRPVFFFAGNQDGKFVAKDEIVNAQSNSYLSKASPDDRIIAHYSLSVASKFLEQQANDRDNLEMAYARIPEQLNCEMQISINLWIHDRACSRSEIKKIVEFLLDDIGAELKEDGSEQRKLPSKMLKRLKIEFVTNSPNEVWEIHEVRTLISEIESLAPWFPILIEPATYSSNNDPSGLWVLWFGSLVPSACDGKCGMAVTPEVIAYFDKCKQSVFKENPSIAPWVDKLFFGHF